MQNLGTRYRKLPSLQTQYLHKTQTHFQSHPSKNSIAQLFLMYSFSALARLKMSLTSLIPYPYALASTLTPHQLELGPVTTLNFKGNAMCIFVQPAKNSTAVEEENGNWRTVNSLCSESWREKCLPIIE